MSKTWGTTDVAFLGGEPTVYPALTEITAYAFESGLQTVRIITNGTSPFLHFLNRYRYSRLPHISFSIDGATADTHEAVRGVGTFRQLLESMQAAQRRGYIISGITSIGNHNKHELPAILALANLFSLRYLTMHYVSARGNATPQMVIPPNEWLSIMRQIVELSRNFDLEIRFEQTFVPKSARLETLPSSRRICVVRSLGNLMFYPDGRVFICGLFLGQPGMHSFVWDGKRLLPNTGWSERELCKSEIP